MKNRPAFKSSFGHFWQARNDRERRILVTGAVLLLLIFSWLLLIDPALEARSRLRQEIPELRNQLSQMRALSVDMSKLPARTATAPVALSRAAIERTLNDKGLKAQNLSISEDKVTASFSDVSFAALTEWLQQRQSSSQLAVSDATVSARDRLGRVDARLTMQKAR